MSAATLCPLCQRRAPRRHCPALEKTICAPCCGEQREQTVRCPFDCTYLREARTHEKLAVLDTRALPNADIEVTERFLEEQERLVLMLGRLLLLATLRSEGAVDGDVRDALAALTATARTAVSGLVYEVKPDNAIAAQVVVEFRAALDKFRAEVEQHAPERAIGDKDLLGALVFWQRMEARTNNQRRKGRAFIESLFRLMPLPQQEGEPASTVEPA